MKLASDSTKIFIGWFIDRRNKALSMYSERPTQERLEVLNRTKVNLVMAFKLERIRKIKTIFPKN